MLKSRIRQFLIAIGIILIALILMLLIIFSEGDIERSQPQIASTLVSTSPLEKQNVKVSIFGFGTLEPNRELVLRSEVSGRIINMSDQLDQGGLIAKGERLVQIDPRDYINQVEQQQAQLQSAEFELELEHGRQRVAKREWELIGPSMQQEEFNINLALRRPHLEEKEAIVRAAKSRLEKALIDLERTQIKSPFDAIILEEHAEIDELVSPQSEIARLAATDLFVVKMNIPYEKLRWINFGKGDLSFPVVVFQEIGNGMSIEREAFVIRLLGDLDPRGRLARLLIGVKDPLGLKSDKPPLLLDSYVRVEIKGEEIKGAFVIPRSALRTNDTVWIKTKENTLDIRPIQILYRQLDEIIVENNLQTGDELITSHISTPIQGMMLRSAADE
ncbi:MAG: efflux RND transporter periplasmic adaptor subunit [Waddliaceae bacterium]